MTPLIAFAVGVAPELARVLSGPQADLVGQSVTDAVQHATATIDPEAARMVVAQDPVIAATLRVALVKISCRVEQQARYAEFDMFQARLHAIAPALPGSGQGRMTVGLGSGPAIVSVLVLVTFAVVMWAAMTRSLPTGSETMVNLLMGTLSTMSASVVAYWVGSSAGSATKTDMLFRSQPAPSPMPSNQQ